MTVTLSKDVINFIFDVGQHLRSPQLRIPARGERTFSGGSRVTAEPAGDELESSLITAIVDANNILTPKRCSSSSGVNSVGSGLWPLPMSYKA